MRVTFVMRIEFTGIDPRTHRFRIVRDDGSEESSVLETRSFLVHLTHDAVERTLGMTQGFYGLLASGTRMAELSDREKQWPEGTEIARAESIVGPMQSLLTGKPLVFPDWPFTDEVREAFRKVHGRWRGTPFGQPCVLQWP